METALIFLQSIVLRVLESGYIPFFIIISLLAAIMRTAHRSSDSTFNIHDTLVSSISGKADVEKIFLVLGGLSVTWWFMDMCARHTATWSEAVAYGGLLGLAKVANKALDMKYQAAQPTTNLGESK